MSNKSNDFSDIDENLMIIKTCLSYLSYRFTNVSVLNKNSELVTDKIRMHLSTLEELQTDISVIQTEEAQHELPGLPPKSHAVNNMEEKNFRVAIVDLMILALQCWEESTQQSQLELAEKSKLWSLYSNNGCLEARTMNRYLRTNTLPKQPRVKNVMKTAYFVLQKSPREIPIKKNFGNMFATCNSWFETGI